MDPFKHGIHRLIVPFGVLRDDETTTIEERSPYLQGAQISYSVTSIPVFPAQETLGLNQRAVTVASTMSGLSVEGELSATYISRAIEAPGSFNPNPFLNDFVGGHSCFCAVVLVEDGQNSVPRGANGQNSISGMLSDFSPMWLPQRNILLWKHGQIKLRPGFESTFQFDLRSKTSRKMESGDQLYFVLYQTPTTFVLAGQQQGEPIPVLFPTILDASVTYFLKQ